MIHFIVTDKAPIGSCDKESRSCSRNLSQSSTAFPARIKMSRFSSSHNGSQPVIKPGDGLLEA